MKDEPNKITATLKVVITGEFYDDEASEETLRYCVEQDLEDAGFDVDVELLKEQEPLPIQYVDQGESYPPCIYHSVCRACGGILNYPEKFCKACGRGVIWVPFCKEEADV